MVMIGEHGPDRLAELAIDCDHSYRVIEIAKELLQKATEQGKNSDTYKVLIYENGRLLRALAQVAIVISTRYPELEPDLVTQMLDAIESLTERLNDIAIMERNT